MLLSVRNLFVNAGGCCFKSGSNIKTWTDSIRWYSISECLLAGYTGVIRINGTGGVLGVGRGLVLDTGDCCVFSA